MRDAGLDIAGGQPNGANRTDCRARVAVARSGASEDIVLGVGPGSTVREIGSAGPVRELGSADGCLAAPLVGLGSIRRPTEMLGAVEHQAGGCIERQVTIEEEEGRQP